MRLTDTRGNSPPPHLTSAVSSPTPIQGIGGFLFDVLHEHAEVAGLMVRLRDVFLNDLGGDLTGLVRLDDRLDAHLDGLRAAGGDGHMAALEALRSGRDGSLFLVAVLSVEQRNDNEARQLITVAEATPHGQREFTAALEWVSPRKIEPWAKCFASSASPAHRAVSLVARHVHRMPLAPIISVVNQMACDQAWERRELAYRALGATAGDVSPWMIEPGIHDAQPEVRLAAQWAARRKAPNLFSIDGVIAVAAEAEHLAEPAFDLAARAVPGDRALELLERIPEGKAGERAGIRAVAAAGRPSLVPWLVPRLRSVATARFAAWAYATVTGCDIVCEGLTGQSPPPHDVGPNDDPHDNRTAIPPEHRFPWPDPDAIKAHATRWCATANRDRRFMLGQEVTQDRLVHVLAKGTHGQRTLAAAELAVIAPKDPFFATRAPGFRQRVRLDG